MTRILFAFFILISLNAHGNTITAQAFMVTDANGHTILEKNADQSRSIASITKLMTAMVVLDAGQDLNEKLVINPKQRRTYHSRLPAAARELNRHTLLDLALVKSDNLAAYTLCEYYPGGVDKCVAAMNLKAAQLQLHHTKFADPTGLAVNNVSTARDLVQLVLAARSYSHILTATVQPQIDLKIKKRWWHFGNTNPLVKKSNGILVSKTGFINQSGGCVVMLLDTDLGQRIVVLLGSKNTRTRFLEALLVAGWDPNSDVN